MKDALKILAGFGLDRELNLYMRLFQKTPKDKFAVIKISGDTLQKKTNILAEDLAFLSKLGLCPIIVHGGGAQIDSLCNKNGIEIKKINGLRITDEKTIRIIKRILNRITSKLVRTINKHGGRAINVNGLGIVNAKKHRPVDNIDLGFVGSVESIKTKNLTALCKSGYTPVLASLGYDGTSAYNINADVLAKKLTEKIRPKKFIIITETGGVLDKNKQILSTLDLQTDLPELIKANAISNGMLLKIEELKSLLEKTPTMVVEICSAENLLQELFTIKGNGTFIRYGNNFIVKSSYAGLNLNKIKKLLEDSFGKKVVEGYFKQPIDRIILDKEYEAVAIVKKIDSTSYLDKFAVSKSAQGNGLGKTLWYFIKKDYPHLIWRSSIHNNINGWYFRNCDGSQKAGGWLVFWYNLAYEKVTQLLPRISNLPKTMVSV